GRARLRGSDRTAARRPRPATVAHGAGTPGDREGLAMSWRETLGIAEAAGEPHAHNPQNAQKTAMPGNSADSADSASADAEEAASRLLEALSDACHDLPITPAAVRDALAPEDIEDWHNGKITRDTLAAFARSLVQRREMD